MTTLPRAPRRALWIALLAALAIGLFPLDARGLTNAQLKRECRTLCEDYKPLCTATNRRGKVRVYRLCWRNLIHSCQSAAKQTFPPEATCTFPCGNDADCGFGRSCVQGQCIIPPLFGSPDPGECSCRCDDNRTCTANADCGVDSLGIPNICGCPVSPPCDGHGGRR
jgi:hypothetical protein